MTEVNVVQVDMKMTPINLGPNLEPYFTNYCQLSMNQTKKSNHIENTHRASSSTVPSILRQDDKETNQTHQQTNQTHQQLTLIRRLSRQDLLKEDDGISIASSSTNSSRDSSTTRIQQRRHRSLLRKSSKGWNMFNENCDRFDMSNGDNHYESFLLNNPIRFVASPARGSREGTQLHFTPKHVKNLEDDDDISISSLSSEGSDYDSTYEGDNECMSYSTGSNLDSDCFGQDKGEGQQLNNRDII